MAMIATSNYKKPANRRCDAVEAPPRRIRLDLIVPVAVWAIFTAWTLLSHQNSETKKAISDVIGIIAATTGAVWGFWGARNRRGKEVGKRGALAANFLSLGTACYGAGAATYAYYDVVLHQSPFPSLADVGYLLGYLGMIVGIVLLPSRPTSGLLRTRVILDSLIVMAALVTFSWYFSLGPTVLAGSQTLLGRILGAIYPVMDLTMMFCVLVLGGFSQEPEVRRARKTIAVGVVAFVVADTGYFIQTLQGSYIAGQPLDGGWMLTNLLFAQAAMALRNLRPGAKPASKTEDGRSTNLWRMLAPYALVPAVAALSTFVFHTKPSGPLATGVYVGAAILLVLILVRQVFAIVENSRLNRFLQAAYRELEALATVDTMTGLANHRVFQERIREELHHAVAQGENMALILIDVDRFKQYNDQFGHPAGDQALKLVASLLQTSVRSSDLAARYGGEEFAVILPNTNLADALLTAERIRAICEETEFPNRRVTLSIGVAVGPCEATALIEQADHALYAAKHAGRNRVVCGNAPLEEGPKTLPKNASLPAGWSIEACRQFGLDRLSPATDLLAGPSGPVVRALLGMLDLRDHDVEQHSDRVMKLCLRLAHQVSGLGISEFSPTDICDLHLGALLHDIGKVGVPDAILHKPGSLTDEEWKVIKRHPIEGAELLESFPELAGAVPIVRSHHERWDGTGYPDALAGDAIPFGARLFALADTFDAMASDRPYRKARPFAEIRAEIVRMSGKQFDPQLVRAFLSVPEAEWSTTSPQCDQARAAA